MTTAIHHPHDKLFRQAMADKRVAKQFFEAHIPPELLTQVKLETLALQQRSFIDENYKSTEADVLYKVQLQDGEGYFYLLVELQSTPDKWMALRLLGYTLQLFNYHRKHARCEELPVVYPLVVYCGQTAWNAPRDIWPLFGQQGALAKQVLFNPYALIDLQHIPDEAMRRRLWGGLMEFVLKNRKTPDFSYLLDTLLPWLEEIEPFNGAELSTIVLKYTFNAINAGQAEIAIQKAQQQQSEHIRATMMTLAQQFEEMGLKKGLEQGIQQGRQQGRQEGRQEGEISMLLRLLQLKFKAIPEDYRQRITQADTDTLLLWGERVLNASTLEDVFTDD